MILPIKLTGQNGLQVGSGVPSFVIDPATGEILGGADTGQSTDPNAVPPDMLITGGAIDPTTGEPATEESILAQQDAAQDFSNTTSVWDTSNPDASAGAPASTDILNTGALRNTRGTQWNRRGSYLTKSAFDNWRDAGRPTSCSLKGFGDVQTADRILTAIAVGANAAAQPTYPNYGTPYGAQVPSGQVTVSGAANPIVWIFGGVLVLGAAYLIGQKR
jgi:hypothetical protein